MPKSWWRHQMETFSALLAFCAGNSPVTGEFPAQRPATLSFDVFFICAWINGWVNNREAGDLRRHRAHYDVTVMYKLHSHDAVLSVTLTCPPLSSDHCQQCLVRPDSNLIRLIDRWLRNLAPCLTTTYLSDTQIMLGYRVLPRKSPWKTLCNPWRYDIKW